MKNTLDGIWYSTFISPPRNIHYFTLQLNVRGSRPKGTMTLVADRKQTDGRWLKVRYRVSVETLGSFVALCAKDAGNPSQGLNTMVLQVSRGGLRLRGVIVWNSLTKGKIMTSTIDWRRSRSSAHADAYSKRPKQP
jgi:hypothetical protein